MKCEERKGRNEMRRWDVKREREMDVSTIMMLGGRERETRGQLMRGSRPLLGGRSMKSNMTHQSTTTELIGQIVSANYFLILAHLNYSHQNSRVTGV